MIKIKFLDKFQKWIEKVFFKGESTKWSKWLTYVIIDFILMLGVFFILLNNILYDFTGTLYAEGTGHRLDLYLGPLGSLDNLIPFIPEWAIFYLYLFYPMVIITLLFFALIESEKGYALGWSLVVINFIAFIIYLFFPVSTYWWRQELLANPIEGNFFADAMYSHYTGDPSFNCWPSLHAAVSVICFYAWYRYYKVKPNIKTKIIAITTLIIAGGVVLSTLFVKQHYIVDEIAGIMLAYYVGKFLFDRLWKKDDVLSKV
ncbi:MAG: phosphatase PAP2 family protein [Promethearchaeota archaeon]